MITNNQMLEISWRLATDPVLYRSILANPYSPEAVRLISENFFTYKLTDVIRATILTKIEGRYDIEFNKLSEKEKVKALCTEDKITQRQKRHFNWYCKKHIKELKNLQKDALYKCLIFVVFESTTEKEIEIYYSQRQRIELRLIIFKFIENPSAPIITTFHLRQAVVVACLAIFFIARISKQFTKVPNENYEYKQVPSVLAHKTEHKFPVRLKIPKINVDAAIQYVDQTQDGTMDVPSNTTDVGWYDLGPLPGEVGNAVISGHFDGRTGQSGVFNNLSKLHKGDVLNIVNSDGSTLKFIVREIKDYAPGYVDEVFKSNDNEVHLNLITCSGVWENTTKSYSKRLAVYADIAK